VGKRWFGAIRIAGKDSWKELWKRGSFEVSEKLTINGNTITINEFTVACEHLISEAFVIANKLIVLYDPDSIENNSKSFNNLVAYTFEGTKIWEADLPSKGGGNCYTSVASKDPLIAYSFSSHDCSIDIETGKIIKAEFCK